MKNRKPIQLIQTQGGNGYHPVTVVLCDDGSMWTYVHKQYGEEGWKHLPCIPQHTLDESYEE